MDTDANEHYLTRSMLIERPFLNAYLRDVREWHGFIRFLGLPDRRDNPDIVIDRLFIEPALLPRYFSADDSPDEWLVTRETIFDTLRESAAVVLLGDPGSGKSTLINYLAWMLSRPTEVGLRERLDRWLLPVPMVLRDLNLQAVSGCDDLIEAFLSRPVGRSLRGSAYLREMMASGRTLLLLDGIDEVGDTETRRRLRDAFSEGVERYPESRWVLSSRIVGYEEVPFHLGSRLDSDGAPSSERPDGSLLAPVPEKAASLPPSWHGGSQGGDKSNQALVRYIAPFDDDRIAAFAQNWYAQREAAATRAGESATHLVRAVKEDQAILRLARIPNLLTMMALVHRIETTLPHGRALLYDRIAEAYLESIDKYRGLYSGVYDLAQKRQWLARVGFELQRRRTTEVAPVPEGRELLVDKAQVLIWIQDEMENSMGDPEGMEPEVFLDIIARRSGLFLPRGEERYAFVHLSFQEYFAAASMEQQVTSLDWVKRGHTRLNLDRGKVFSYARKDEWFEVYSFLFEMLSPKKDWHSELVIAVFGEKFEKFKKAIHKGWRIEHDERTALRLAIRLVANPRAGLSRRERNEALRQVIAVVSVAGQKDWGFWHRGSLFRELFSDDRSANEQMLQQICEEAGKRKARTLDFEDTKVGDVHALGMVESLQRLNLRGTRVKDISPVGRLRKLRVLTLDGTGVQDLGPVRDLRELRQLSLDAVEVADLKALRGLGKLEHLDVGKTGVSELGSVEGLTNLRWLGAAGTRIRSIEAVENLVQLIGLNLADTDVSDICSIAGLLSLEVLNLDNTGVEDLEALRKLTKLKSLSLRGTRVKSVAGIEKAERMERLILWDTRISDIAPLEGLSELEYLDLDGTEVRDAEVLKHFSKLQILHWRGGGNGAYSEEELRALVPQCHVFV